MNYLCKVKCACQRVGAIHLVDKCLLLILGLLMLQSAINLFVHEAISAETNGIDVVVRTSAASIFGYIISINFNQHRKRKKQSSAGKGAAPAQAAAEGSGVATAQIGFQAESGGGEETTVPQPPILSQEEVKAAEQRCDRSQILVVATVGVVSLIVLLVFRNFLEGAAANASSVTQFRDFVSGSVGFLISCSTSGVEEEKR